MSQTKRPLDSTRKGVLPDYNIRDLGEKDALDIALEIILNKTRK